MAKPTEPTHAWTMRPITDDWPYDYGLSGASPRVVARSLGHRELLPPQTLNAAQAASMFFTETRTKSAGPVSWHS